jgi:uncharacterized protein (UPF0333 family)
MRRGNVNAALLLVGMIAVLVAIVTAIYWMIR